MSDAQAAAAVPASPPNSETPGESEVGSVPVLFVTQGPVTAEAVAVGDETVTVTPVAADALFGVLDRSVAGRVSGSGSSSAPGAVVLLDGADDLAAVLAIAARLDRHYPTVASVLVADATTEVFSAAMRVGVRDVVPPDAGAEQVMAAIRRASAAVVARSLAVETPATPSGRSSGRVITVTSPKGGSGKTTVTTNLAVELGRRHPAEVVVVDLDLQFGDVASCLKLEPTHSVVDAVSAIAADDVVLKSYLAAHESGCYALCAPPSPADGEKVDADQIAQLVRRLAAAFPFVLIDTAPGLLEATLAALDASDDVVFLSGMDVPSVRGLHRELGVLDELRLLDLRRHVVVNFVDRRSGLTIDDIEAMLGMPVAVELPRSKAVPLSTNRGVPLLQEPARGAVVRGLRSLTDALDDATARRAARRAKTSAGTEGNAAPYVERRGRARSVRAHTQPDAKPTVAATGRPRRGGVVPVAASSRSETSAGRP